jgi:hypothetical protein
MYLGERGGQKALTMMALHDLNNPGSRWKLTGPHFSRTIPRPMWCSNSMDLSKTYCRFQPGFK